MASVRLTHDIRNDILESALSFKFKKEDREAERKSISQREIDLVREIYTNKFGKEHEIFKGFPYQDALDQSKGVTLYVRLDNGFAVTLSDNVYDDTQDNNKSATYYAHLLRGNDRYSKKYIQLTGDLSAKVQKYLDDKENHTKSYNEARAKLKAFLYSYTTLLQLQKQWPEGEPFYRKWIEMPQKAILPAVVVQDINKMFNIPLKPEEDTDPIKYDA